MGDIADWLAGELPAVGVEVRLGTRVDAGYVRAQRVDRLIVATGSVPRADGFTIADPDRPIPGVGQPHVRSSWDAITDTAIRDARAVVYDDIGHHEAVSVAEALMARGCEVVFVSRLNRLMPLLEAARMETTVKKRLYSGPFEFIGDSRIARVGAGEVTVASMYGAPDRTVEAGLVVVVGGNEPQRRLADELAGELDVSLVGDALGPRFLQLAILEGYRAAVSPDALPSSSRAFEGRLLKVRIKIADDPERAPTSTGTATRLRRAFLTLKAGHPTLIETCKNEFIFPSCFIVADQSRTSEGRTRIMTAVAENASSRNPQRTDEPALIVSSDGHAMAEMKDYRPYLPREFRAAFDDFLVLYARHGLRSSDPEWLGNRLDPDEVEKWRHDVVEQSRLAGDFDPHARIAEMDRDGRTAEILFPDFGRPFELGTPIRESLLGYDRRPEQTAAGLPAHNRWLADFVSVAPVRFGGMANVSFDDVEGAMAEIRWARNAGLRGVLLPAFDEERPLFSAEFDPVWSLLEDLEMPLNCHVGASSVSNRLFPLKAMQAAPHPACVLPLFNAQTGFFTHQILNHLIWGGVLEASPGGFTVVFTEFGSRAGSRRRPAQHGLQL